MNTLNIRYPHLYPILFAFAIMLIAMPQNISAQSPEEDEEIRKYSFLQNKVVVPTSPEAANFGKFGDFPVNYYTGAVNISIPIHTLQGKQVSLPISLNYDATGNKVETLPAWTGQGWNLNSGGMISRAVQGKPDMDLNYYSKATQIMNPPTTDLIAKNNYMQDTPGWRKLVRGKPSIFSKTQPYPAMAPLGKAGITASLSRKRLMMPMAASFQNTNTNTLPISTRHAGN